MDLLMRSNGGRDQKTAGIDKQPRKEKPDKATQSRTTRTKAPGDKNMVRLGTGKYPLKRVGRRGEGPSTGRRCLPWSMRCLTPAHDGTTRNWKHQVGKPIQCSTKVNKGRAWTERGRDSWGPGPLAPPPHESQKPIRASRFMHCT